MGLPARIDWQTKDTTRARTCPFGGSGRTSYCRQCTVIFINQLRSKVGVIYGSPEVTSGGNALKFYSSVRLDTRRKEILPDNKGIRVKVKVVKNKVAAPFKAVMLDILFGEGIDSIGCMLDAAFDLGVVERRGSWYAYQGKQLAQGRINTMDLLKTDAALKAQVQENVRLALAKVGKPDVVAADDDKNEQPPVGEFLDDDAVDEPLISEESSILE